MPANSPIESALRGILPERCSASVLSTKDLCGQPASPFSAEASALAGAAAGRQAEFSAGRAAARSALEQAGFAPQALPSDALGLPIWPDGAVASISHSRGLACAVAAKKVDFSLLGLDLEKTNRISPAATKRVVHPIEADWVDREQGRASLLFGAKEAFFKAQFPVFGAQPSFQDIAFSIDASVGQLSVEWFSPGLDARLCQAIRAMEFRFAYVNEWVFNLVVLRRAHQP